MRFREYLESKITAGIFFTDGESVLLLKRKPPCSHPNTWGLPGGHAESDETALETAKREAEEECGRIEGKKIGKLEQDKWTVFFYEVKKPFHCDLSSEHNAWRWINFKHLSEYKLHPEFKKQYRKYIKTATNLM